MAETTTELPSPRVASLDDAQRWLGMLRAQLARERRRTDLLEMRVAELARPWWRRALRRRLP